MQQIPIYACQPSIGVTVKNYIDHGHLMIIHKFKKKKNLPLKVYLENLHFQKLPFLIQTNYIQVIAKISSFCSYKNLYLKVII